MGNARTATLRVLLCYQHVLILKRHLGRESDNLGPVQTPNFS